MATPPAARPTPFAAKLAAFLIPEPKASETDFIPDLSLSKLTFAASLSLTANAEAPAFTLSNDIFFTSLSLFVNDDALPSPLFKASAVLLTSLATLLTPLLALLADFLRSLYGSPTPPPASFLILLISFASLSKASALFT